MKKIIISLLVILSFALCLPVTANATSGSGTYSQIDNYLLKSVKLANIPGMSVIIVDKDNVLFSNTYGNCNSIDTPFIIGSMSKSFTAVSILQLVEQGKVNIDNNMQAYLPDVAYGDKITVRQLLNQTSGLGEYQRLSNMKITTSYGSHQYANVNYCLLGKVIESVSGMSYEEYVTENIFKPLDMKASAASLQKSKASGLISGYRNFFGIPISGKPDYPSKNSWSQVPAGYISSSATDMGKYLQMYLSGGDNIISSESVITVFYDNVEAKSEKSYYYGMGWSLSKEYEEPILGHSGLVENYMSNMFILPESGIGVVLLANTNDYLVADNMFSTISKSIVLMLMNKNPILISRNSYLISHLLIDGMYLAIFLIALLPFILLKRYKNKLMLKNKGKSILAVCSLHIILPTALLMSPRIFDAPLWVVRYYVPDLFLTLLISASLLYIGGVIKVRCLYRTKSENINRR